MLVRTLVQVREASVRGRIEAALAGSGALIETLDGTGGGADGEWAALSRRNADVLVVERDLFPEPASSCIEALRAAPESPEIVVVMPDGFPEERARLMAAGCRAVIAPALSDDGLRELLAAIVEERRALEIDRVQPTSALGEPRLSDFVSASPAMQAFLDVVERVVATDASLLIQGETGVGKERLAKAIHADSRRSDGPFVPVNCAALPETLLESELFGHEEGAFTGATRTRRGWFELAHGGTLFLDEIGEMPIALQAKLLRAVQEREIQPLGSERAIPVDARIMAATNRDLRAAVEGGTFRGDLYYRLGVVTLTVPPLRERREDVPALARNYVEYFAASIGRDVRRLSPRAMSSLRAYDWPGNVRELMNVIERAVLLCRDTTIHSRDLPEAVAPSSAAATLQPGPDPDGADVDVWQGRTWRDVREEAIARLERSYLDALLRRTGGRVGETAELAGMRARSLFAKMRRYGLRKEDYR